MSKVINLSVDSCIVCPYCKFEPDMAVFEKNYHNCSEAQKLINGGKPIGADTPIPKWCPLPDGNRLKYFVIKKRAEDVTDDYGMEMTHINELQLGEETFIMLPCEKDWGYVIVDDLNYLGEKNVGVILGRLLTEKEVDLDRGGTQRKRGKG